MIAALALAGCPVSPSALTDPDPRVRQHALDQLPTWQARREVERLEKWAEQPPDDVQDASLRALVRADSPASRAIVARHAARARNFAVTEAIGQERTRAGCELLAELYHEGRVVERGRAEAALCRPAVDRLACGISLGVELPCLGG